MRLDVGDEELHGTGRRFHRLRERRRALAAECVLEAFRSDSDVVEVGERRETRETADRALKGQDGLLGVVDSGRVLGQPQGDELRQELVELASAGTFLRDFAERHERRRRAEALPARHRFARIVEREPGDSFARAEGAEVDAGVAGRLCSEDSGELLVLIRERHNRLGYPVQIRLERHGGEDSPVMEKPDARKQQAVELFAPLGPTYDRYANLLSFGQDPRWRRFLVSRIETAAGDTVLDVASGTAAVAIEVARRTGSKVVGLDQSKDMLEEGRRRVAAAGLSERIELVEGTAERLPFDDASFDALTFTYLLRYVDDPEATMRELARVVRPGGTIAMLEFGLPRGLARPAWELWVRMGLPGAGALIAPGWRRVGSFLGPSIRGFHRANDVPALWRSAGIEDVQSRRLSLGGGLVVWGRKA